MLQFAVDEKLIVVLWGEDESDSLVGYVDALKQDTVTILNIDEYGEENGKSIFEIESITSMDVNTKREQILKFINSVFSSST